jgi:hypothetical protein
MLCLQKNTGEDTDRDLDKDVMLTDSKKERKYLTDISNLLTLKVFLRKDIIFYVHLKKKKERPK